MHGSQFFSPDPRLDDFVDALWDLDMADAEQARGATTQVLPTTSPLLAIHYRDFMRSSRQRHYMRIATGIQSSTVTIHAGGAIGAVLVRLKSPSASRIFGCDLAALTDTHVALDDIFGEADVSRLVQMLAEAAEARQRIDHVEDFLLRQVDARQSDPLVARAMRDLKQNPAIPLPKLALRLDVSERHLRRRFTKLTGASPKMFARVARVEKIVAARFKGARWCDIAYGAGYSDQAHLVNEFTALVGKPPEAFFRGAIAADYRAMNGLLARSDFYNTFVT